MAKNRIGRKIAAPGLTREIEQMLWHNARRCGFHETGTYRMAWRIGIDIGGTFTDVALVEEGDGRIAARQAADHAAGILARR